MENLLCAKQVPRDEEAYQECPGHLGQQDPHFNLPTFSLPAITLLLLYKPVGWRAPGFLRVLPLQFLLPGTHSLISTT